MRLQLDMLVTVSDRKRAPAHILGLKPHDLHDYSERYFPATDTPKTTNPNALLPTVALHVSCGPPPAAHPLDHTDKTRIRQSPSWPSDRSPPSDGRPICHPEITPEFPIRTFLFVGRDEPRTTHHHQPQQAKQRRSRVASHGFISGRRGEHIPGHPPGGPGAAERAHRGPVRVREAEKTSSAEEGDQADVRPAAVVPRRGGARLPGRLARRRLRVRPVGARQARGVPAVRPGLAGPEPGQERARRRHRHPLRVLRRQVHPAPALQRGLRPPAVPRVRAHPWPLGHARHPRRPLRRVAHRRHMAGRRQGGAGGRVVVPGPAAAVLHLDADLDRGARDRLHRVPAQRGAGPGEEAVPGRILLRPAWAGGGPGEEGAAAAGGDQARAPRHGRLPRLRRAGRRHRQGAAQQLGHAPQRPAPHHHLRHVRSRILLSHVHRSKRVFLD